MTIALRTPTPADADALADLLTRNRVYFQTGEPLRPDEFYTPDHQAQVIRDAKNARQAGASVLYLIEDDGAVVGRANLNSIIRGAFQSASVGYAVDQAHPGRGVATAALRELIRIAFTELGLHRLQGETLVDNTASQRVLTNCGFVHYGTAPDYLRIHGKSQTHDLFQLINTDWSD